MSRDTLVTGSKLTALANSIRTKAGIQASMTLDQMKTAVDNISTGGGTDSATLKAIIECESDYDLVIPNGVTSIGFYAFYNSIYLKSVTIPNSVVTIDSECFAGCSNMSTVNIGSGVTSISYRAFYNSGITSINIPGNVKKIGLQAFIVCQQLTSVYLAHGVESINGYAFAGNSTHTTLFLPNTLISVDRFAFNACSSLEFVTLENGFNCDGLYLSYSTKYSAATIVSWLNALADRTGLSAYTLHIGSDNITKLSAAEIAIATNKNWNLD